VSILVFLVLLVLMYAVLIVPQQRRVKAQRALLAALEEGDVVLTSAGIYGVITELSGDDCYLEVAEGIELKITKSSVAGKVRGESDAADAASTKAKATESKAIESKATEKADARSENESDGEAAAPAKTPSIARGWRKGR
jgi:preprotein translocase subunit YajC